MLKDLGLMPNTVKTKHNKIPCGVFFPKDVLLWGRKKH
jgi:hypothetical protein